MKSVKVDFKAGRTGSHGLCDELVAFKRHDTASLGSHPYRPDVWAPSGDLAGGVSQVQTTVHAAVETLGHRVMPRNDEGDRTGEVLFNVEPRSCLVAGSLEQFQTDRGVNVPKFRSFELYRRHMRPPEIITFDGLLQRARFIVEHGPEAAPENNEDDEIPF